MSGFPIPRPFQSAHGSTIWRQRGSEKPLGPKTEDHRLAVPVRLLTISAMPTTRQRRARDWTTRTRLVFLQRGTPENIALGVAIGMFIAFTPTLGVQIMLALVTASILKANRLAALSPLIITNALTAGPIYGAECWIGARFVPESVCSDLLARWRLLYAAVAQRNFHEYVDHERDLARLGWDLWLAMWIRGLLVGGVAAIASYWAALGIVRAHRHRRAA